MYILKDTQLINAKAGSVPGCLAPRPVLLVTTFLLPHFLIPKQQIRSKLESEK